MTAETTAPEHRTTPPAPAHGGIAGAAPVVLPWVMRQQRRSLLLWAIAVGAVTAIYVSFFPAMGDGGELEALVEGMPEGMVAAFGYDGLGTAAGYLESTIYGLLGPILLLVFGLGNAARLIAGNEEEGALELELTGPVSRRRVLAERALALTLSLAGLCVVVGAVAIGLVVALDLEVGTPQLLAATLGLFLLVLALSAVALAAGAATGRRSIALGAGAGLGVAAYIANALAPLLDDGTWLERISPFGWYLAGEPLVEGLDPAGAAALLTLTAVAAVVALVTFDRRDLGV